MLAATNNSTDCAIAAAFLLIEDHNRQKAKTIRSERESLRYGQLSLEAARERYKHYETCPACKAAEANAA